MQYQLPWQIPASLVEYGMPESNAAERQHRHACCSGEQVRCASPAEARRTSGAPKAHRMALQLTSRVLSAMAEASLMVRSEEARVNTPCGTTTCQKPDNSNARSAGTYLVG
eukprot:GHUV01055333.1.p5 GENE.GHUV01055333.1~~GHUV01055333.1.p5  ORF type:complete len:111 (-),score=31.22 GHUV01055333.1:1593-1925(-)